MRVSGLEQIRPQDRPIVRMPKVMSSRVDVMPEALSTCEHSAAQVLCSSRKRLKNILVVSIRSLDGPIQQWHDLHAMRQRDKLMRTEHNWDVYPQ